MIAPYSNILIFGMGAESFHVRGPHFTAQRDEGVVIVTCHGKGTGSMECRLIAPDRRRIPELENLVGVAAAGLPGSALVH